MTEVKLTLPDELAKRVEPLRYFPTILEISLLTPKTSAALTKSEFIEFLSANPSPREVLEYHGTRRFQERVNRLLELNRSGMISEIELIELDELLVLDHVMTGLKINISSAN